MIIINDNENSLIDLVERIVGFDVFINGKKRKVDSVSSDFFEIKTNLIELFSNCRLMPAFGVSLHSETLKELQKGEWLQINFSNQQSKNGLFFSSLLFKLENVEGFNLIRFYNDKYEGRCLFLDLDEETDLRAIIGI